MEIPKPDDVEGIPNLDYPVMKDLAKEINKKYGAGIKLNLSKTKLANAIQKAVLQHVKPAPPASEAKPEEKPEAEPEPKPEAKPEEKPEPKPKKNVPLYVSHVKYRDLESGWSFNPRYETKGKPIEKMTAGIKNAINDGKITLVTRVEE